MSIALYEKVFNDSKVSDTEWDKKSLISFWDVVNKLLYHNGGEKQEIPPILT